LKLSNYTIVGLVYLTVGPILGPITIDISVIGTTPDSSLGQVICSEANKVESYKCLLTAEGWKEVNMD
jgi:hypothetical protein